jgi:beta-galactosidase
VQETEIRAAIEKGYSISLYMVDVGTSFGWMNGANSDGDSYQPDVTSYDNDAPIDEEGSPRPKYFAMRAIIEEATHRTLPAVPVSPPMMTLPALELREGVLYGRTCLPRSMRIHRARWRKLIRLMDTFFTVRR